MMIYDRNGDSLILPIYVDGMLIIDNNSELIQQFIKRLNSVCSLKDLGDLSYFLGIEVTKIGDGLHLNVKASI